MDIDIITELKKGVTMAKFMDKLFGSNTKQPTREDEFTDLDLSKYEEVMDDEPAETYIRVGELTNLDELSQLKREIYDGNILMLDISNIKADKLLLDRALKDLKEVVTDVHGDIAGLREDQVLVTPAGVKIDRDKIIGGKY